MTDRTSNRDFHPPFGTGAHPLAPQLVAAVREAGAIACAAFGKPMKTWLKHKGSPVSETDIAVDAFLKARLAAIAPDAGWLSEETADAPGRLAAPRVWIVDPIDGTRAFIAGRPDWTVSVALVENGRPVVAALYAPASEELFLAAAGAGVTCNGMPIRASSGDTIAGARISGPKGLVERFAGIAPAFRIEPLVYSLALRFARVADGTLDAAFASRNSCDWDLAAADLLVHEAGGALTTTAAATLTYNGTTVVHDVLVAAGWPRHRTLCALLRQHEERW
jgi:myo-inositol-1(or 4)-monophosphatase